VDAKGQFGFNQMLSIQLKEKWRNKYSGSSYQLFHG